LRVTLGGTLRFVTSNQGKLREARSLLSIPIESLEIDLEEIQAPTIEAISLHKLEQARRHLDGPLFVEDVALGFDALGGFPGPYVKWLLGAAGGEGIGRIAAGLSDRSGSAVCQLALWDGATVRTFQGECRGQLLAAPRGSGGFGWDAWFEPEGQSLTYAEMGEAEKSRVSHRGRAYALLSEFLSSRA
jgi:non-canonical purine NTP pyrophosphatase (RdgB/HAM1 family)